MKKSKSNRPAAALALAAVALAAVLSAAAVLTGLVPPLWGVSREKAISTASKFFPVPVSDLMSARVARCDEVSGPNYSGGDCTHSLWVWAIDFDKVDVPSQGPPGAHVSPAHTIRIAIDDMTGNVVFAIAPIP